MAMGAFGWEAIHAQGGAGAGLDSLVREATCYYLNDSGLDRLGWRYPRFRAEATAAGEGWELTVGQEIEPAFALEAARQGVSAQQLLQHALLYYLADLHSGRVAERILAELD